MYYQQDNQVTNKNLGMVIIGVICVSIFKNISIITIISTKSAYIMIRSWIHKKIGHQERKKKRLRQERKERQKKETKANDELLRHGVVIDPTEMEVGQQVSGRNDKYVRF
jgi:hypothetical protein